MRAKPYKSMFRAENFKQDNFLREFENRLEKGHRHCLLLGANRNLQTPDAKTKGTIFEHTKFNQIKSFFNISKKSFKNSLDF